MRTLSVMCPHIHAGFAQFEEICEGVNPQEPQENHVDNADEGVTKQGIDFIKGSVDDPTEGHAHPRAHKKPNGQGHGHVAQLLVHGGLHDGLGKDMKKIRPDCQNAFDAGTHESGCNDKAASGPDASRDQAGTQPDQNGNKKNPGIIESRRVGFLAAQHARQSATRRIRRKGHRKKEGRKGHQTQDQQSFSAAHDGQRRLVFPSRVRLGRTKEQVIEFSHFFHFSNLSISFLCICPQLMIVPVDMTPRPIGRRRPPPLVSEFFFRTTSFSCRHLAPCRATHRCPWAS